ncbi:trp operon leader peptide [Streptomyces purpureus]
MGETDDQISGVRPGGWGRVRGMFAQTTQNWWWTAHPAAH